jgi:plastocyanin
VAGIIDFGKEMTWRVAAVAALFLTAVGCSGNNGTKATVAAGPKSGTTATNAEVTGTIATSLAPPMSLLALEFPEGGEMPVTPEPAIMDQVTLAFLPAFLIAQAGQPVDFRNSEDVLHNIRVTEVSGQKPVFNIASPPYGKFEYKFERPGMYTVGCDIHSTMRADILITSTPYTTTSNQDGSFTIPSVRPGSYKLTVYGGGDPVVRNVEVKGGRTNLGVIQ